MLKFFYRFYCLSILMKYRELQIKFKTEDIKNFDFF